MALLGEADDPDREMNPIILQFMAKSTLRAVLNDKNALKPTLEKRGLDINMNRWELTDNIFSQLKAEKTARAKELQRQFLTYLMASNGDLTGLLKDVFCSFVRAVKKQKEENGGKTTLAAVTDNEETVREKGWKKLKNVRSQPDFGRLMKGLRRGQEEATKEGSLVGSSIRILDTRDPRAKVAGLSIKSESAKGQAWELSDGSYVTKEHQGTRWIILSDAQSGLAELSPMKSLQTSSIRSSSTGNIRRRPSVPELLTKVVGPSSRSGKPRR